MLLFISDFTNLASVTICFHVDNNKYSAVAQSFYNKILYNAKCGTVILKLSSHQGHTYLSMCYFFLAHTPRSTYIKTVIDLGS